MYPDSMTDKELEQKIDDLTAAVEFIESGLDVRDVALVQREAAALYMALSSLHEEKVRRNK